jgi:hypothetical protein
MGNSSVCPGDERIEVLVEKTCGGSVRLVNCAFWGPARQCLVSHCPNMRFLAGTLRTAWASAMAQRDPPLGRPRELGHGLKKLLGLERLSDDHIYRRERAARTPQPLHVGREHQNGLKWDECFDSSS